MKTALLALIIALVIALGGFNIALAADETDKPEWDVNDPPGSSETAHIDVSEGTWINLDVSPDGKKIVFDLLGDLFIIPIEGGEAKQITEGMAWDMQPRYSPNGKAIAFTSDRNGGDNIWIMRLMDDTFHQVTKEDFRLLNNPIWTPDGNYIAARKHYTGTRSLGAGEIWLYHRSGGKGVQMVARANEQKDINDPAFSSDGRYLYYDQDVTPGDTFEYNKDSNGEIYAIKRLDRKTGETITYISGAGGAIRPTPSPDGKWLAFIRRVRFQSTLFLKNIESGKVIPVYDDMERDMQEIWAIHGVYTGMDWTPDSQSLVFWADGHIKRLNISTRKVQTIPFHVEKDMEIRPALRYPVEVAPDTFKTRMLRWVTTSPDGSHAVFEALGHLYKRPLSDDLRSDGEATRITQQTTHFELQPAFSRDGRYLAYVTWDDQELGTLRVRDLQTGEEVQLNRKPGHFVEPVFSPDGKTIVFRRIEGGYLRAPRWDEHSGVYAVPTDGIAPPRLITKDGAGPQFGDNNNRVFLSRMEKYDKRLLVSLELDGSDLRTHFTSTWAADFEISPDGQWLAFQERYNVYVAPFVRSGQTIELSPNSKSIPVQRVSEHGGNYLHWSGGSLSLHWSLGPKLMTRDLNQTFAFLAGGADTPDEIKPGADGADLGFTQPYATPDTRLALVGARLLTMSEAGIIENGVVIIEGNQIRAIGPHDEITVPEDMPVLDVSGKTIMPGIVDVHWHGAQGTNEFVPEQNWVNYASLAFGVTTIHDPSNDTSTIFAAAELAKANLITAPRIFSTGTIMYGATTAFTAEIESYEDALHHLKRLKAQGAFSVKSYNQPRRNQRQQVIAAARELEMMVVPEGGALFNHNMTMVVDGHTGVEHSLSVANIYADVIQLWSQTEVGYTPTLGVAYGGLSGERYWYSHTNVWENKRLLSFVPYWLVDPVARRRMIAPLEEYNYIDIAEGANQLHDAGVGVQLGAHGQREGLAAHWGIWSFVQGGMTPLEALKVATIEGARYLGMDHAIGSLEKGKLADLIVLDDNPLENIRNSQNVHYVMVNGRLYDAASMNEIRFTGEGKEIIPRQPFFWEELQDTLLKEE